jgi:hypothetical protein
MVHILIAIAIIFYFHHNKSWSVFKYSILDGFDSLFFLKMSLIDEDTNTNGRPIIEDISFRVCKLF